jgi:Tol biopolymer transport system component
MIGTKLAHYEITAHLGSGGMGDVYQASDTKLNREVAIKVLPETVANDAGRMARFEREAKVLASLNHPNIAHVYGVEERALVMELAEGESPKGPMPFDDAWKIAMQIADALEYAHEKGIVHRDLKPANIKVTPDGVVKLLDFGLAKAFQDQGSAVLSDSSNSPTITLGGTVAGVVMGTAAYMAPEQAKGKRVDSRADVWAFGVVLYELLTGKQLFGGEDLTEILASVVKEQPDLRAVDKRTRKLLEACLQKDPRKRLQAIGDARYLLVEEKPQATTRVSTVQWVVAAVALVAAALAFVYFRETRPQQRTFRYTIAGPENITNIHSFAISPDGRFVAIAADVNGKRQLWLRALDALQPQIIPGTDDATYPFWSPDSQHIGFFALRKLKKIAVGGGLAQTLCDAIDGRGGSWNRADVIVFSPNGGSVQALQRVAATGGVATDVTSTKGYFKNPIFLPDGHRFLYTATIDSAQKDGVYIASLDGGEARRVLPDASTVVFGGDRLLFIRENTLMAQPFDAANGQTLGEALPIAAGVSFTTSINYAPITVSENGILLYEVGGMAGSYQMAWYDRAGKLLTAIGEPGLNLEPAISPDEKSVVFRRTSLSGTGLLVRDLARGTEQRLAANDLNITPFWSPQGDSIVFSGARSGGTFGLYQSRANGTGQYELLLSTPNNKQVSQWSRDGRFIVFSESDPKTKQDIWVLPMGIGIERKPIPFLRSEFNEFSGQLSPDCHWMAYTSDESGQREVYVRPFPGGEGQWKISVAGGELPRWRGDGKELFFIGADGKMTAVSVEAAVGANPSLKPEVPKPLFEVRLASVGIAVVFEYDVTADGKRFLLDTTGGSAASTQMLNVIVNWTSGLKK